MLLQKCLLPVQLSFTILLAAAVFTAGRKSPPPPLRFDRSQQLPDRSSPFNAVTTAWFDNGLIIFN